MDAVPGVSAAGLTTVLPLGVVQIQTRIFLEGRPEGGSREGFLVPHCAVSPNYFRAMGIPLLRGRTFTEDDRSGQPPVIIVSEAMARRFWPGE